MQLKGKIALITGASRGIGAAVAKRFAAEGAHVIITARTIGGLEEVDDAIQANGGISTIVPLDLRKHDQVDQLANHVAERFGMLDVAVLNAGVLGTVGPIIYTQNKHWNEVMDVNVTANHRILRAFAPLLRQSDHPRVIGVTSGVADSVTPNFNAYAVSKAAFEMMIKLYAAENETFGVKANLLDPGIVATRMRTQAMPGEDASTLRTPEDITDAFVALAKDGCSHNGIKIHA